MWGLGLLLVFIVALSFWIHIKKAYPYARTESLCSTAEAHFYSVLQKNIPAGCRIFMKVRIADVVHVTDATKNWKKSIPFNKITSKHFDFVITDSKLKILGVIELDDSSHKSRDRKKRDIFIDNVCIAAKLPILHVKPKRFYDRELLRKNIMDLIN